MKSEKLEKLLAQVEQTTELANRDLSGWDPRSLPGVQSQKREAQETLDGLVTKYKTAIRETVALIVLAGDAKKAAKVAAVANEQGVVVLRADNLYRRLATTLEKTMDAKRTFSTAQSVNLVEALTDLAREMGVRSLPLPKVSLNDYSAAVTTIEDTVTIVRRAIRATSEDDLNILALERDALGLALEAKTTDAVLPVVLYAIAPEELGNLSTRLFKGNTTIVVDVDKYEDDKDFLASVQNEINEKFAAVAKQ